MASRLEIMRERTYYDQHSRMLSANILDHLNQSSSNEEFIKPKYL